MSKAGNVAGTAGSRTGLGMGTKSRVGSQNGSIAGASSVGTRSSTSRAGSRVSSLGTRGSLASAASGDVEKTGPVKRMSSVSSSRLLAPTASSLARRPSQGSHRAGASGRPGTAQGQGKDTTSSLNAVAEDGSVAALGPITNKPGVLGRQPQLPPPAVGKIFSKPLGVPPAERGNASVAGAGAGPTKSVGLKPKVLPGRKPRISRSRVIARLASQRVASGSGVGVKGVGSVGDGTSVTARTRSSLGAAKRRSFAGGKGARGSDVVMSAKKRARQSEYARRKSRGVVPDTAMDTEN